ncbi:PD-(D/E)XK nuclease family protein [Angustibacter peucedani]
MAQQLGFEGMPQRLYSATPTRLLTWLDCPRRYRFTYLDRPPPPKGPPWAHTSVGTSVHLAMSDWYALEPHQRTPQAAGRAVVARWRPEGFRDDAQLATWRSRAAGETAAYAATQDASSEPLGVERTVAARTSRLALSGRVDRLDDRDGELVVVDYKTSRRPLGEDDARTSLPLAIYAMGVSTVFRRPCRTVELHHVPTGEVVRHEFSEASLQRKLDEADSIATDLGRADAVHAEDGADSERSAATFAPRTSPLCGWCDFRAACPEGRQAAPAKAPWSALEPT